MSMGMGMYRVWDGGNEKMTSNIGTSLEHRASRNGLEN
jgi:hypothetical protein